MGIKRLARDIVPKAKSLKLNNASVAKMKKGSQYCLLPRLIVQCGAVSEQGCKFCSVTYHAEGNDPLPFDIYITLDELDEYVDTEMTFGPNSLTWKCCKDMAALTEPQQK